MEEVHNWMDIQAFLTCLLLFPLYVKSVLNTLFVHFPILPESPAAPLFWDALAALPAEGGLSQGL